MATQNNGAVAVLTGNGLSIAVNRGLALNSLTQEILRRIREDNNSGDAVADLLVKLADRLVGSGASPRDDFEALIAGLDIEADALGYLELLGDVSDDGEAITQVISRITRLRNLGMGHVLETIHDGATAASSNSALIDKLLAALRDAFHAQITIGNLNYDLLLHRAMLRVFGARHIADMASGKAPSVNVRLGDSTYPGRPLRKRLSDFASLKADAILVDLHGSLDFWGSPDESIQAKVPQNVLESRGFWASLQASERKAVPLVVLGSEGKAERVTHPPFSVAYEKFGDGLSGSKHWLIVGYSFRDDPVNKLLRKQLLNRESKPKILVVTKESEPTDQAVLAALGLESGADDFQPWLRVHRDGVEGVTQADLWDWFVH